MTAEDKLSSILSYFQYYGVPFAIIAIMYRLLCSNKFNSKENLKGKVVFISGASSGVGEALAHCFYSHGCKVVLAARREPELQRVKNNLLEKKLKVQTYEPLVVFLDLAKTSTIQGAVEKVYDTFGPVEILINNGGISSRGDVMSTDIDVHRKLMDVNYLGPVALTKEILKEMIKNKNGHIVFVSSIQGRIAIPDRSAYAASKHACQAFADTLRAEVKKHHINVSVISPGYIRTALSANALTGSGEQYGVMDATTAAGYSPELVAEKICDMVLNKTPDLVLAPATHRFAVALRCLVPSLYFWIMARRAK